MPALKYRALLQHTWPLLLASLGSIVVGLVDALLVSHYSATAVAGVALGAAFYELGLHILLGALMAHRILAPRVQAATTESNCAGGLGTVLRTLLPAAALFAAVAIMVCLFAAPHTADPAHQAAFAYTAARAPGLVCETVTAAFTITLVAWGKTRVPVLVFALVTPANLLLDWVLIYGVGPVPELGAFGAGLGSAISALLPMPVLLVLFFKNRDKTQDKNRACRAVNSAETAENHNIPAIDTAATIPDAAENQAIASHHYRNWRSMARPAVASAAADYLGSIMFALVVGTAGVAALAALRFGALLHLLAFVVISSVSTAALYLLGRDFVRHEDALFARVTWVRRVFLLVGVVTGGLAGVLGVVLAPIVSPDAQVQADFLLATLVVALLCPVAGACYGNVTILRAYGRTGLEFAGNALGVWAAQLPVAVICALVWGGISPFAGLAAYWLLRFAISRHQVQKHILIPASSSTNPKTKK
ncbi:MAG: MATE family efflux transporter [Microbacteriaceae bacterium]|nr:MATE family efflux transporter [Microbacteriaceae bacterium]